MDAKRQALIEAYEKKKEYNRNRHRRIKEELERAREEQRAEDEKAACISHVREQFGNAAIAWTDGDIWDRVTTDLDDTGFTYLERFRMERFDPAIAKQIVDERKAERKMQRPKTAEELDAENDALNEDIEVFEP